jgi:hypothetical protein
MTAQPNPALLQGPHAASTLNDTPPTPTPAASSIAPTADSFGQDTRPRSAPNSTPPLPPGVAETLCQILLRLEALEALGMALGAYFTALEKRR